MAAVFIIHIHPSAAPTTEPPRLAGTHGPDEPPPPPGSIRFPPVRRIRRSAALDAYRRA